MKSLTLLLGAGGLLGLLGFAALSRPRVEGKVVVGGAVADLGGAVALIGDSIGVGVTPHIRSGLGSRAFESFAVVGYPTSRMLQTARAQLRPGRFATVIVEGHLNDGGSATETISNLRQILILARESGARTVLVTSTPWRGHARWTQDAAAQQALVLRWARSGAEGLADVVVDAYSPLDAGGGHLRRDWEAPDHLHLNQAGYRGLARIILDRAF